MDYLAVQLLGCVCVDFVSICPTGRRVRIWGLDFVGSIFHILSVPEKRTVNICSISTN